MQKVFKLFTVGSAFVILILTSFINKISAQDAITIDVPIVPEANRNQKYSVSHQKYSASNHRYIFNSFFQSLPILVIQKGEFETTDEYNKRFAQAYSKFSQQLQSNGININNYYNIKINRKAKDDVLTSGYLATYNADEEELKLNFSLENYYYKNNQYSAVDLESISKSQNLNTRGGRIIHEKRKNYKLVFDNISESNLKDLSLKIGRNEAKELLLNNSLGIIFVCKFVLPYIDIQNKFSSLSEGGNYISNTNSLSRALLNLNRALSTIANLANIEDIVITTENNYLLANIQKVVIYNTKNGKNYGEFVINSNE